MKQFSIVLVMVIFLAGVALAVDTGTAKKGTPVKPKDMDTSQLKAAPVKILQVTYPVNESNFIAQNNKVKVTVRFNIDVDQATVVAGSTVKLDFPKATNAPGQITWVNSREFIWEHSANSIHDICTFKPDCGFKLTLTDDIKSKDGSKLDGNKDNQPGGNFTRTFIYIG